MRRLWRILKRTFIALFAFIIAVHGATWVYHLTGRLPPVDYAAAEQAVIESYLPPEGRDPNAPNAWDLLEEAARRVYSVDAKSGGGWVVDGKSRKWNWAVNLYPPAFGIRATGRSAMASTTMPVGLLAELEAAGVFDLLGEAAATLRAVRTPSNPGPQRGIDSGPERTCLRLCRALAWRLQFGARNGDDLVAAQAFEQSLALSRVMGHQGGTYNYVLSFACASTVVADVWSLVHDRAASPQLLRLMLEALERQPPPVDPMLLVEVERMDALSGLQQWFAQVVHPGGLISPVAIICARHGNVANHLNAAYDDLRRQVAAPPWQRIPGGDLWDRYRPGIDRYFMTVYVFGLFGAIDWSDRLSMFFNAMRLLIAIELFALESGRYPDTLDELVPSVLASLPIDPYAPDGRFRYCVVDPSGAAAGLAPFALWTVGADGVDNGGLVTFEDLGYMGAITVGRAPGLDFPIYPDIPEEWPLATFDR